MCYVWIWEQTAIISLCSINWLVFITETESVYCAVRTGYLNTIELNFTFWRVKHFLLIACWFCIILLKHFRNIAASCAELYPTLFHSYITKMIVLPSKRNIDKSVRLNIDIHLICTLLPQFSKNFNCYMPCNSMLRPKPTTATHSIPLFWSATQTPV
jgi:hypothetical protein